VAAARGDEQLVGADRRDAQVTPEARAIEHRSGRRRGSRARTLARLCDVVDGRLPPPAQVEVQQGEQQQQ
jgi:hypothetical protein